MKELDRVKLTKDRARYREQGMHLGDIGRIMEEERYDYLFVVSR